MHIITFPSGYVTLKAHLNICYLLPQVWKAGKVLNFKQDGKVLESSNVVFSVKAKIKASRLEGNKTR